MYRIRAPNTFFGNDSLAPKSTHFLVWVRLAYVDLQPVEGNQKVINRLSEPPADVVLGLALIGHGKDFLGGVELVQDAV
ncbi:hypothetical protein HRbin15_00622 [bacterium HR15]|nr:hypothetical protein HRbin15_00622 [bacterium HR15]